MHLHAWELQRLPAAARGWDDKEAPPPSPSPGAFTGGPGLLTQGFQARSPTPAASGRPACGALLPQAWEAKVVPAAANSLFRQKNKANAPQNPDRRPAQNAPH